MKLKIITAALALSATFATTSLLMAADHNHGGGQKPAEATKSYPLTTCVVSGEKLGEMGAPFVHKHNGREVRLCCKGCLKDFNNDPQTYLKKLDAAEKK